MSEKIFNSLVAFCSFLLSFLFGEFTGAMASLVALSAIDYASGVMQAIKTHTLSSSIGFNGIFRKAMIFLMIGVAHIVDCQLPGEQTLCRDAVIYFYLANEGISIFENAIALGVPVPAFLKDKLLEFNKKTESKNNKQE